MNTNYKIIGRNNVDDNQIYGFSHQGITFSQHSFNLFAGLCAVDNLQNVDAMMKALSQHNLHCTRMGAYKPRTSPYAFQGLGKDCLPYVFESAGKYGIKIIAMEVTHERHIEEITTELEKQGQPTSVMLQIGTRNAQNFELIRQIGSQTKYPVLFKRGYGITLEESLQAAEYCALAGNPNIVFCLRGVKSLFGAPHRNLADFSQISVIHRLTKLPVCIDPSHAIGINGVTMDGLSDISNVCASGLISGANMVLVDFHPNPKTAVVDSQQAISIHNLGWFLEDLEIARTAYQSRKALAQEHLPNRAQLAEPV